jgi:hypothetical protein
MLAKKQQRRRKPEALKPTRSMRLKPRLGEQSVNVCEKNYDRKKQQLKRRSAEF